MKAHLFRACLDSGLTRKQALKVEDVYDEERKRLRRENEAMKKNGISVTVFSALESMDDMMERVQVTASTRPETPHEAAVRDEQRNILGESLMSLRTDDREFMLELYFEEDGNVSSLARRMGIPRETVRDRNKRILAELKKYFAKKGYFDADF